MWSMHACEYFFILLFLKQLGHFIFFAYYTYIFIISSTCTDMRVCVNMIDDAVCVDVRK